MAKQTMHKLVAVILVLFAFGTPFYLESQITSLSTNSYLLGALARGDANASESEDNQTNETDWLNVVGTSFIGESLQ